MDTHAWHEHCAEHKPGMPQRADLKHWTHMAVVWHNIAPDDQEERATGLKVVKALENTQSIHFCKFNYYYILHASPGLVW